MRLMDVLLSPWAITPESLCEISEIYFTHLRGDKIDIKGVEARLGRELNNTRKDYQVTNGVAIIDAAGVIAKRANLFMEISGGVSTQILGNQIEAALVDKDVNSLILNIDSPGGTVDGTFELADKLYSLRGEKTIVAMADGLMASAAYAIGSAADAVYISGPTTHVGSIGVVAAHRDYSGYEQKLGIKTTEIYAGKYKRISSQYEPLSAEGRQEIQDSVDFLYSVFVERVAKFRDVAVSTVLEDMADGRIFIGQQAIDAGLVDGETTLQVLVDSLAQGQLPTPDQRAGDARREKTIVINSPAVPILEAIADAIGGVVDDNETLLTGDTTMSENLEITRDYVAEHHPEIAESFRAEGADAARTEGATAERERIQAVLSQSMPGHEVLIQRLAFDGETTGPEAAMQVLQAEKANTKKAVTDDDDDAAVLAAVPAAAGDESAAIKNLPLEERAKIEFENSPELQAEFKTLNRYIACLKTEKK